jgi:hypothetical protein
MPIKQPTLKGQQADLADWIEVTTLASPDGTYRLNSLKRYWDTHRETETSDPEGKETREESTDDEGVGGADDDAFLDSINDELGERETALKGSYPFAFSGTRFSLKPVEKITNGGYCYLFCLLVSNCKAGDIFNGQWLPDIDNVVRDLFQACSTLAAAGEVSGCAISFGWPRPTGNPPFLEKLKTVYTAFGEGKCVNTQRPGVSPNVKDAAIDVIAWRPRPDRSAGKEYLLGQVASGDNWEAKSIKGGPIEKFHRDWFTQPPASQATASIFIPHAMPPIGDGGRRERMDSATANFGRIFDRLLLPSFLAKGIDLAKEDGDLIIERLHDFPKVIDWVDRQMSSLRAANGDTQ